MSAGRSLLLNLAVVQLVVVVSGCHSRGAVVSPASSEAPDSIRGVMSITGTGFEKHLVLTNGTAQTDLSAAAPLDSQALTRLAGVEIQIRGERTGGKAFLVQSYTALRVEGQLVVDGVIVQDSGSLFLRTSAGLRRLGNPPSQLRNMVSARVWVGGPLDTGPNTYGIITLPVQKP